jgi:hypothetical protein
MHRSPSPYPLTATRSIWDRVSASYSGPFRIARRLLATDFDATSIAVLPTFQTSVERSIIAVGYADSVVRVWLSTTGELLATLTAHTEPIFSLTVLKVRGHPSVSQLSVQGLTWAPRCHPPVIGPPHPPRPTPNTPHPKHTPRERFARSPGPDPRGGQCRWHRVCLGCVNQHVLAAHPGAAVRCRHGVHSSGPCLHLHWPVGVGLP